MTSIPNRIIAASLINLDTGERIQLEQREGSYCHFSPDGQRKRFAYYELRFRLDWKDLGLNGDPTLDVDLFDVEGNQLDSKTRARVLGKQHHVNREFDNRRGVYLYRFEKGEVIFEYLTETTNQVHQTGTAMIVKA